MTLQPEQPRTPRSPGEQPVTDEQSLRRSYFPTLAERQMLSEKLKQTQLELHKAWKTGDMAQAQTAAHQSYALSELLYGVCNRESIVALQNLGRVYQVERKYLKAKLFFRSALRFLEEGNFETPALHASLLEKIALLDLSHKENAVGPALLLREAMRIRTILGGKTAAASGQLLLGVAYFQLGDKKKASKNFREGFASLRASRGDAEAHFELGRAYYMAKQPKASEKHLCRALTVASPELKTRAHHLLGVLYMAQKRWEEAEGHLLRAVAAVGSGKNIETANGKVLLAQCYRELGSTSTARKVVSSCATTRPSSLAAIRPRIAALLELGCLLHSDVERTEVLVSAAKLFIECFTKKENQLERQASDLETAEVLAKCLEKSSPALVKRLNSLVEKLR